MKQRKGAGKGLGLALASTLLVSAAQLALRWGMARLPLPADGLDAWQAHTLDAAALASVCFGILAYALSMLCWLGALQHLPLSRAYALLSISYALVHLGAALLPGWGEALSVGKALGVALVVGGVLLIHARPAAPATPAASTH
ncbi:4-amino-4-deoxy-L-arabinose-phosphoundecaprenol flippase subunit ArnF [Extensimonas sp. H3M7-6]|uniref:4-amino-4-deoxy-L-arabinose-phosphoundecaprenol flippase subunit ArnF n=1 Tax=Extensimonas soli TaxID=3031322 RepID=UPI0023DACFCD|nr:4-amino-4-deoxy-L-arabinose-phosphoundecaprenol flippase subunit ArnF [Extensimonas sp. H3M7-6]MDF1481523.1 4-amino-4-deoxy-L-arabinose-phosphoundecaprenol flippase subunit ArnF [Extensimonas sp. H3M7-6]